MPKKISDAVTSAGVAKSVPQATSMSDGKSYIRNPNNRGEILQIQSKEGNVFKCFVVTKKEGTVITVDSTKAVYISEIHEAELERI